ncbi:restriction endonuclease subunit S [Pseudorhodoferax sp. LjRoot39]|uniref:restriction endonuclease subunit S n=1 Tax=Pseudorhodoferax sp. LjRoot39 TaxID=3342328 RepID=UPI003ECCFF82
MKRIASSIEQGWSPQCENFPAETPDEWGVMKVGCVNGGTFRSSENKKLPAELQPMEHYSLKRGDLLISRANTRELVGSAAVVPDNFHNLLLCDKLYRLRADKSQCVVTYLAYYLGTRLAKSQMELDATGASSSMLNIGQSAVLDLLMPLPRLAEQEGIATFLDHETAKIDALIAEQEKLIALLAEKRQATISHAVTRGLDSDAPMKDSGVAWLGEVPAHWKVGKAGFYISILPGYAFPSAGFCLDDTKVRLLRGVNVGVGELRWEEVVYWKRNEADRLDLFELRAGDVVIGMDRPLISTGMRVALVKANDLPCLLLQRVAKIQPGDSVDPRFIMRLLGSRAFEAHFAPETTGVSVPHISGEQIASFVIPVPPMEEQGRICDFIETELGKLDALNRESQRAVSLLTERRSALIAAAVTGQIDVRDTVTA